MGCKHIDCISGRDWARDRIDNLREDNAALRAENALDREARERAVRDIATIRAELAAAKEEVDRLREEERSTCADLLRANAIHVAVVAERAALRAENAAAKEEVERLKALAASEVDRAELVASNAKLRTTLEAMVENARRVQEQRDALKAALEPSEENVEALRIDAFGTCDEHEGIRECVHISNYRSRVRKALAAIRRRAGLEAGG